MSDRLTKGINAIDGADYGDIEIVFRCATCFCSFAATESQPVKSINAKTCPACAAWRKVMNTARLAQGDDRDTNASYALIDAMDYYANVEKPEDGTK